jgi:hypothetical protein
MDYGIWTRGLWAEAMQTKGKFIKGADGLFSLVTIRTTEAQTEKALVEGLLI